MADVEDTRLFLADSLQAYLAGETARISDTPLNEASWDALLDLAAFHRVAPLLHKSLREAAPHSVPPSLEAYVRQASTRGLLLTGELLRLLKRWEGAGVQAIPFKGPALAVQLYGDPALRQYDDLDVIVRAADFQPAQDIALALGWLPREQHSHHHTFSLWRGDLEIILELHWEFMPLPDIFPFDSQIDAAWARCETIALGGYKARAFAPEDQLLYLCAHGGRHLWRRLQWICDVAQLIYTRPDLDWTRLMAQAKASGGQRMLFLGLSVAQDLLGAPLSPAIAQTVRGHRHTAKLTRQVKRQYFEEPLAVIKPWKETFFPLQLIDRPADRLAYLPRLWWHKFRSSTFGKSRTSPA